MPQKRSLAGFTLGALAVTGVIWACDAPFEGRPLEAPAEAGAEASVTPPAEAGRDSADVPDAGLCPPNAFLCDDFERGTLLGPWGTYTGIPDAAADASSLAIDTAYSTSPTRSLRSDPRGLVGAALTKLLPTPGRVDVTFSLRVQSSVPIGAYVVNVELTPGDGYVQIILQNDELQLLEQLRSAAGGEYYLPERATDAPIGAFARYTLRVDRTNKYFALLAQDGKEIARRTLIQQHGPISRLSIGAIYTGGPSEPYWIDDVVVVMGP